MRSLSLLALSPVAAEAGASADYPWDSAYLGLNAGSARNWTFISPSVEFVSGERTGTFRIGKDDLLTDANGRSWISYQDFAIALFDKLERPVHSRKRFTVGY